MNDRFDDFRLALLTKLPFSTGDQKNVIKEIIILLDGSNCVELGCSKNLQIIERNVKYEFLWLRE